MRRDIGKLISNVGREERRERRSSKVRSKSLAYTPWSLTLQRVTPNDRHQTKRKETARTSPAMWRIPIPGRSEKEAMIVCRPGAIARVRKDLTGPPRHEGSSFQITRGKENAEPGGRSGKKAPSPRQQQKSTLEGCVPGLSIQKLSMRRRDRSEQW